MYDNKKVGDWKLDCEFNGKEVMVQIVKLLYGMGGKIYISRQLMKGQIGGVKVL